MTRAIIYLIGADVRTLKLYCNHDSYIRQGLGEALYRFCEQQRQGASSPEVLYGLFTAKNEYLDLNRNGDEVVDYIYKITCSPSNRPQLMCWEVDWSGDNKRSIEERMGDPVDIEAEINRKDKDEWPGLFPCPYCGSQPSIVLSSSGWTTIHCNTPSCLGNIMVRGNFFVAHDAEIAWNNACKRLKI